MITQSLNLICCLESLALDSQGKWSSRSFLDLYSQYWVEGKEPDLRSRSHGCLFLHHLLQTIFCISMSWRKERIMICAILSQTLVETSQHYLICWDYCVKLLFWTQKNTGLNLETETNKQTNKSIDLWPISDLQKLLDQKVHNFYS